MNSNLVEKTINKIANVKNNFERNQKNNMHKDYSDYFKKLMMQNNMYVVRLSTLPKNYVSMNYPYEDVLECEDKYSRPTTSLLERMGKGFSFYPNFNNYYFPNDIQCSISKYKQSLYYKLLDDFNKMGLKEFVADRLILPDTLIVTTGESMSYVREIITGEMIPVLYYNRTYFAKETVDETLDVIVAIRNNLYYHEMHGENVVSPYYIRALEVDGDYQKHTICNFNIDCCLNELSSEQLTFVLEYYHNLHHDIEQYRKELLLQFSESEKEVEKYESGYEQQQIENLPKTLVKTK